MVTDVREGTNLQPRTHAEDPQFLPVCFPNGSLLYYDATTQDRAWIATQDPVNAREYR
jgi:hypothetical protein